MTSAQQKTPGILGLAQFQQGANGVADDMNDNFVSIDQTLTTTITKILNKIREAEAAIGARSAEAKSDVEAATAEYAASAEVLKDAIVVELKDFLDDMFNEAIQRALDVQNQILASIDTTATQLTELDQQITDEFARVEAIISQEGADVRSNLEDKFVSVQTMHTQLMQKITAAAQVLSDHIGDTDNPHRVSFAKSGGSAALHYSSDSGKDVRYI